MIVNSPAQNHVKLIVDETDLKNSGISLDQLKSNPQRANSLIKTFLGNNAPVEIAYSNIVTYDFKVFRIEIFLK